jgi:hypothetical protein
VVDKTSLLNFLQYRNKAFKPDYFESAEHHEPPRTAGSQRWYDGRVVISRSEIPRTGEAMMSFVSVSCRDEFPHPGSGRYQRRHPTRSWRRIIIKVRTSSTFEVPRLCDSSVHGEKAAKTGRLKAQLNSTHAVMMRLSLATVPLSAELCRTNVRLHHKSLRKEFAEEIQSSLPLKPSGLGRYDQAMDVAVLMTSRSKVVIAARGKSNSGGRRLAAHPGRTKRGLSRCVGVRSIHYHYGNSAVLQNEYRPLSREGSAMRSVSRENFKDLLLRKVAC